jgi:hypothetical protein
MQSRRRDVRRASVGTIIRLPSILVLRVSRALGLQNIELRVELYIELLRSFMQSFCRAPRGAVTELRAQFPLSLIPQELLTLY